MDNKLLKTRLEIFVGIILVLVVTAGILFFIFRVVPEQESDNGSNFSSFPIEEIKYLDVKGDTSFKVGEKTISLPASSLIITGYNNTNASDFECITNPTGDCTIYDIDVAGTTFYISNPQGIKLKAKTAAGSVNKNLNVAGTSSSFTYTQRKFATTEVNSEGQVTKVTDDPSLTTIEEVYGCNLTYNLCFATGRLSEDKAKNAEQVTVFENFVQGISIN